jgi:hypothetical protein
LNLQGQAPGLEQFDKGRRGASRDRYRVFRHIAAAAQLDV